MRAGKLRHRVQVQSDTVTIDAAGGHSHAFSTVATRWASIEPQGGREFIEAGRVDADVTHIVKMRHYSGLTPQHRLMYGSRVLNIANVVNMDERNRETVVMCREDV